MNPFKLITKPIGCLCSLIGALILGVILLAVFGLWGFNQLAPKGVKEIVESRGGFPVTVDEAGWHLMDSAFVAEDIIVQNPPNFPEPEFLHVRTLSLSGDAPGWISGEVHDIDTLTLDIARVNWVRTEGGSSNVALFSDSVIEQRDADDVKSVLGDNVDEKGVTVHNWIIRIGTVEVSDYSRGPVKREKYLLNYEKTFSHSEPAGVVVQAVSGAFSEQGLQPMINQLLMGILSVPDIDGLADDLNPAPAWLKEKLKGDDSAK